MLYLLEMNKMYRTGFRPRIKLISMNIHLVFSGLNEATAAAILYAGVPGFNLNGTRTLEEHPASPLHVKRFGARRNTARRIT